MKIIVKDNPENDDFYDDKDISKDKPIVYYDSRVKITGFSGKKVKPCRSQKKAKR